MKERIFSSQRASELADFPVSQKLAREIGIVWVCIVKFIYNTYKFAPLFAPRDRIFPPAGAEITIF